MKNKQKIVDMVKFAALASITFLIGMVPQIGYLTFIPFVAITTVHIPVLIGAVVLPFYYALGLGLIFGITSFFIAYNYGSGPIDLAFQNPVISITPRVIFAGLAFLIILILRNSYKKLKHKTLVSNIIVFVMLSLFTYLVSSSIIGQTGWKPLYVYPVGILVGLIFLGGYIIFSRKERNINNSYIPTAFIVSTFVHSLVVFTFLALMAPEAFGENADILGLVLGALSFNGVIEALLAAIVGTPIVVALYQLEERTIVDDFDV